MCPRSLHRIGQSATNLWRVPSATECLKIERNGSRHAYPHIKPARILSRPLRVSLWDVAFYSLMVGLGESYLSAFVLTLSFCERASGLLVTVPTLIGSIIQLLGGFCMQLFGSGPLLI